MFVDTDAALLLYWQPSSGGVGYDQEGVLGTCVWVSDLAGRRGRGEGRCWDVG